MRRTVDEDRDNIAALLEQYRLGFVTLNAEVLTGLWDQESEDLLYQALEETHPRRTLTAIANYYRSALTLGRGERVLAMNVGNVSIGIHRDMAHVLCHFEFIGDQGRPDTRYEARGRASFVLVRRSAGWRIVHYLSLIHI